MNKKWLGAFFTFVVLFFVTGCTKAIPAEEAAPLFLDAMIYEKNTEDFQTNFSQSTLLEEVFAAQSLSLEENFTQGLVQSSDAVDEQVAKEISEALMKQVKEVTDYEVKKVTETESIVHVTYEIQGFDLMALFKESTMALLEKIMESNELLNHSETLMTTTVEIIQEKIPTIQAKEETTEMTLQLKQVKGKWEIVEGQEDTLASLYLAFYAGVRTEEELTEAMARAMTEVIVPFMGEAVEEK